MIRGTTPVFTLGIDGYDLTEATVYVTIGQGSRQVTVSGERVVVRGGEKGSVLTVRLTQEETLVFNGKANEKAFAQVRFIYANGDAYATDTAGFPVEPVLLEGVIEYAGD